MLVRTTQREWTTEPTPFRKYLSRNCQESRWTGRDTDTEEDETDDTTDTMEPSYEYSDDVLLSELLPDPEDQTRPINGLNYIAVR